MLYNVTDGGKRASGYYKERRDCTVRALAVAGQMSYRDAHKIMAPAGRRPKHSGRINRGLRIAADQKKIKYGSTPGLPPRRLSSSKRQGYLRVLNPVIGAVLARLPKGRYLLCTMSHAFAVIDGVIYDSGRQINSWSRIVECYTVTPIKPVKSVKSVKLVEPITQAQINEL